MRRAVAWSWLVMALLCVGTRRPEAAPGDRLLLLQPEYLSALEPTPLTALIRVPEGGDGLLSVYLRSEGAPEPLLLEKRLRLVQGENLVPFDLPPAAFSTVNLHEECTLRVVLLTPDRNLLEEDLVSTLLPEAAPPGPSAWGVAFTSRPVLAYTSMNSSVGLTVANPTSNAVSGKVQLTFQTADAKKKVSMNVSVTLPSGTSEVTIAIPASMTIQAKSKGCTLMKAFLKVGGVVKAKDTASVDYDLTVTAAAAPSSGNIPLAVTFTGTATGGQPPYAFRWDFGDGGGSTQQNASHSYAVEGSYNATLWVTDALGGEVSSSRAITATVPPLTAACSASPAAGLAPLNVNFTASASGGTGSYTFDWDFGDGSVHSTLQNPSHVYASGGSYTARVLVGSGAQSTSCAQPITVTSTSINLECTANPAAGRVPLTVTFTASASGVSGGFSYRWEFGDGTVSLAQNPTHAYGVPGRYHAVVTAASGGQTAQCTKDISVTGPLISGCSAAPLSGAVPLTVFFVAYASGGSGLYTFQWSFGDGGFSTLNEPYHTYYARGTFIAICTISDGIQTQTCSQTVKVN